ncbi:radical SAM protein [candidate division WOR-3 bacterium]|nr:radical SAM protein [candidate division WOR-3 bacterium]
MAIKKEESDKFYQKMTRLAYRRRFPLKAMFELTYRCNFRCIHCYVVPDKNKKELTTEQVKGVLNQLKDDGCFHIGFTGGEPLVREDIFEILSYAKRNGFRISLLTNGFLVDKRAAVRIASLGTALNRVDISILGATKRTFERITQKEGGFERVLRSIKFLKDEGVDVQIKATLMKTNKDEFLKIKELAEKFNTMFRYSPTINPKTNGDKSPLRYQIGPEELYRLKQAIASGEKVINEGKLEGWNPEKMGRKNLFGCGAGSHEVSISPYGEMNLCLAIHYPEYNILEGSFKEGWERIKEFVKEFRPSKGYLCRDCVLAPFCSWCPARAWLLSGNLIRCSEPDRAAALVEAKHSPIWKKIAPIWEEQKNQRTEEPENYAYKQKRV